MEKPKVCIITATYNRKDLVKRAIKSVKEQDYDGKLIHFIVDDCSTDGTLEELRGTVDNLISTKERCGPGGARNEALNKIMDSEVLYVGFLDSDDWYRPNAVSLLVESIGDYDAAYGDLNFKEWDLKDGEKSLKNDSVRWSRDWRNRGDLKGGNFIPLPACLFKIECFQKWGVFREDIGKCNDWEMLSRFEANGARFKHIPYIIGEAEWIWGKETDGISTQGPEKAFPTTTWSRIKTLVEGNYI